MSDEKICPMMAQGWLANKYSARGNPNVDVDSTTWDFKHLPKCLKSQCAMWSVFCNKCGYKGDN